MGVALSQQSVSGRLNEFQRTMLQWSRVHPYNAVHVARVQATISPEVLGRAATHVLGQLGVTFCSVSEEDGLYRYEGGGDIPVRYFDEEGDVFFAVEREIEYQLNEPFPWGEIFQPFRFFLVQGGGDSFVGIAYFHAVSDAHAVVCLLGEVLTACFDAEAVPVRDLRLARRERARVSVGGVIARMRRLVEGYRKFQAMRRCHRSPNCPVNAFPCAWRGHSLDEGATARVLALARQHDATVNDLCLAALLRAVVPVTEERIGTHRSCLAVGCVVNLRQELEPEERGNFGLFLGSFAVTHPVPPDSSLIEVLSDIRGQTARIKREKLFLGSRLEFRLNRILFDRQHPDRQRNFYRKAYPAWGSITNFRVDSVGHDLPVPVLDYYRAVSTGPAQPFVIGVTGYAKRLNLGFSYRPGVVDHEIVKGIEERFIDLITGRRSA